MNLFLRLLVLINTSPIFHFKYVISELMVSLFLSVGLSVVLLLGSVRSVRKKKLRGGGKKRLMRNRQKLREREDVKVLDDEEVKFTDL